MNTSRGWEDAIRSYLRGQRAADAPMTTLNTRRQHLEHLARRVDAGPWELTSDALLDYVTAQSWARETRRSRRVTFLSFWRWAIDDGRAIANPADALPHVRAAEPHPMPVPDGMYLAALARADDEERLWIDLAAEHGLRRAEIAVVHSSDLVPTLIGYDLRVHGKGGKPRDVPLTSAMERALLARSEAQGAGFLFGGDVDGHVSPRWVGRRVGRLLEAPYTIHKLRHRAATRFYVFSGGDVYVVARLMGWANPAMVPVYVAMPDERLRATVERASRGGAPLTRAA